MHSFVGGRFISLERRSGPYLAFCVPVACVSLLAGTTGVAMHQPGLLMAAFAVWLGIAPTLAIMAWYRITWSDREIRMRAVGMAPSVIRFDSVDRIALETSRVRQRRGILRPSPRVVFYGKPGTGAADFIDVSLRHFSRRSVHELLIAVGRVRSDLSLPDIREGR